jgi:maltose alpha-D-glucosyltransferase/alpha-amylase
MAKLKRPGIRLADDPFWYKDAVIYELHVRAFHDQDGNGVGDFRGLTEKLDYLQDLGITVVWLLPFYPSPLKDDGYDIADYLNVHPSYGSLQDFKLFLREAHHRGIRVITELVLNHTSDQHPWFQAARRASPGSKARQFYVWSDTPDRYQEARIIFKDFETSNWTWDPLAKAYYWHRFYSHQPDLNFDNPKVRKAMLEVLDYWLELGVDGLRLDAVPYLYEREETNCENLAETHEALKELRRHVEGRFRNRLLLAEANQWPEDAIAYFGAGDECHMAFHFPLMPRLFMSIRMESRFPIMEILKQTPDIPESCQWALFLRNHDELTLEMVTDEERDYMYRVYARDTQARINLGIRRRLAPLLSNDRKKIELMNGLLLSMPGTPVIYYGDEIGMGDNVYLGDRNGVRTPMQWSADRNAGFSRSNPQKLYLPVNIDPEYHYEAINVDAQQANLSSLLWWMKRLIGTRKRYKAFGRGSLEFLYPENPKILAFLRRFEDETVLVVANLSRFAQGVLLDLSAFRGSIPVELSGNIKFYPIDEAPYPLTLGAYSFYWFKIEARRAVEPARPPEAAIPTIGVTGEWEDIFPHEEARQALEQALPEYLKTRRWFGGKARTIRSTSVFESLRMAGGAAVVLFSVEYDDGEPETYALPLAFASGDRAAEIRREQPASVVAQRADGAVIYDAVFDPGFREQILAAIARRRRFKGWAGELTGHALRSYRKARGSEAVALESAILKAEQSNTSVVYGDKLILKLFRRLDEGVNPDLEIGRFLTEKTAFASTPQVAGYLEYRSKGGEPMTFGILQAFVPHEQDAWSYTLETLSRYFERVLARRAAGVEPEVPRSSPVALAAEPLPVFANAVIGTYIEAAQLLGLRTAEMHLALASGREDPSFAPEPFTPHYQRSLYQSMRSLTLRVFQLLRGKVRELGPEIREKAERVLELETEISSRFRSLIEKKITGLRIRCHGDYHLGQVLYTGKDFVIIDFEGEPARSLGERRIKRSPLRDVAGMLRSFHYADYSFLLAHTLNEGRQVGLIRPEDLQALEPWAQLWYTWVSAAFLGSYLEAAEGSACLPRSREELERLMNAYLLEKAVYELGYELNNRPAWVQIPLSGILRLLDEGREP